MTPEQQPRAEATPAAATEIAGLIERWQDSHDAAALADLVAVVRGPIERVVASTLRRHGIRDPAARDDAVALVLERLFRMGNDAGTRPVAHFDTARTDAADPGLAFLHCMARSRAHDVARAIRRHDQHMSDYMAGGPSPRPADPEEADVARLSAAIDALDARSRQVVGLLLEGKSQAVIAHVLGVCEGTVSRIRGRAIQQLHTILAEKLTETRAETRAEKRGGQDGV